VLVREGDGVADVVAMSVGAKHDVYLFECLLIVRALGIAHDPRVDEKNLAAGSPRCEKSRVPAM